MVSWNSTNNFYCWLWPDKPSLCTAVEYSLVICSSISVAGSIFIIFVIWVFKLYRVYIQRLILGLTCSACLLSFSCLFDNIYYSPVNTINTTCYIQAFMIQYFLWANLTWVILITVNMVLIAKGKDGERYEKYVHLTAWINPLIWAMIPLLLSKYGHAGIWCWIKKEYATLRFGIWYAPLLTSCCLLICTYIYMFLHNKHIHPNSSIYQLKNAQENNIHRKEVKPLIAYPLIYISLTIPIFIYRLYDALSPSATASFPLLIATAITFSFHGVCNAVVYGYFCKTIRDLDWQKFKSACYVRFIGRSVEVTPFLPDDDIEQNGSVLTVSYRHRSDSGD